MTKSNLRLVKDMERDLDDQIELIQPYTDIEGINEPVGKIAEPANVIAAEIYVDHAYQRDISGEGERRVKDMIRGWNWALFEKPLLWIDSAGRKIAIDGQHTTKAWVSHPGLPSIMPVNILTDVHSDAIAAEIFMGRNLNRIRLHHLQEFKAALVAKKEWALELFQLAKDTGVRIPFRPEFNSVPNTLMSIEGTLNLMDKYGYGGAKRVLNILTEGALRPIRRTHLAAVAHLLFGNEFKGVVTVDKLKAVIRSSNDNIMLGTMVKNSIETKLPRWESLALAYFQEYQKRFPQTK